jgi:DNA-binding transcriptional ArsR family regulator
MSIADADSPECSEHDHGSSGRLRNAMLDPLACQRAADLFSALGDLNRLRVLMLISAGKMCVSEIADAMDDNLPAVSQRLKLLKSERIVKAAREGKHVYYELCDDHIAELVANALAHARE